MRRILFGSALIAAVVAAAGLGLSRLPATLAADPPKVATIPNALPTPTIEELQAEIKQLKDLVPDQAHGMSDVGYHCSNLWFAAQAKNWPLADFYLGETISHLHWAVRLKPIRKDKAGATIDLPKILEALENSPLKQVKQAIAAQDPQKFEAAYRFTLEGCYACHKACEKPYLHPRIPERPDAAMINFDPAADWPK